VSIHGGDLTSNVVAFCRSLRSDLGFRIGHAEAHDALRAMEVVGVRDVGRVRSAMRLVLCTTPEEVQSFDEAFDAFFRRPDRGVRQELYAPRQTRRSQAGREGKESHAAHPPKRQPNADGTERDPAGGADALGEIALVEAAPTSAAAWESMRALYSPAAGSADAPALTLDGAAEFLRPASELLASVRVGRVRRWRSQPVGPRLDLRRTLRASLQTGGEPMLLKRLGHPIRNPRFVLLIDGSRSMASYGTLMLRFGYALCRRWQRTHIFLFSTALRDVTRDVRKGMRLRDHRLTGLGEAWGGGTKIGASLSAFVKRHGALLTENTVAIIYSDGMEVGEVSELKLAMREMHRRSAAVMWVNPLASTPGYEPSARGMRAAMPYVTAFLGIRVASDLDVLSRTLIRCI
jgi:hypothetical protein